MGSVFHIANHEHWKDMATEEIGAFAAANTSTSLLRHIDRSSCQLCLQILQAADSNGVHDMFIVLYAYAMPHFEAYLTGIHQQTGSRALSWLDGCQVLTIGLCCTGFWVHNRDDMLRRGTSQHMLRQCLQVLTSVANHFEGLGAMRDLLWQVHDAAYALRDGIQSDAHTILRQAQAGGFRIPQRDERLLRTVLRTAVS